ncbi:DNA polymerase III subunit gamma/tau [Flavobacteriaceae bacterium]|nr:DNA polymerase III subunit gamma/tau [Flavobacteriaceae bacterium]
MEPFIVSARKYRPTTFKDVVGQKAITNTLENAIENNHLAQALLFTGPRGVGKTTCARILAKKINQDGSHKEDEDFAFNIFELDAASNNSVDDIRNLIDQVRIPPQVGQYKVYIIDEVHMLSSAAFNAFLKTLEEPPKHAIFILATTEKHKIIPTILSRCQIFDFRRITVQDIKGHLASVAQQENITAQDDALHVIAQKADGALRDALSIFDRVVSFSGENLTREAVTENLNVLDYTYYFNITDLVIQNDIPQVLLAYNEILSKGFDGHHFIMGLASHFRDLLVCKNQQTISLLEVGDQVKKMYLEQSQQTPHDFLIEALDIANSCDLKFKTSRNQRLLVELCLMQLSSLTAQGEKKKANKLNKRFVLPPSHFKEIAAQVQEKLDTTQKAPVIATPPIVQTNQTKEQEIQNPCSTQVDKQETLQQSPPIKEEVSSKKRVSALSLKSIQKKQQLTKEINARIPNQENLPTEDFTQQQMITHWNAYTEIVKGQGKYNFLSHLTMNEPKLKDGMIHLEFPNQTIKIEVERDKFELLTYMRKELKNYNVDLVIDVNELQVKRYAYTDKEKYEKLLEKNPNLEALRNAFELDI